MNSKSAHQLFKKNNDTFWDFWNESRIDKFNFVVKPIVSYAIDQSLSAFSYQAAVKEANNQIKLDTAIKENRVIVIKDDTSTKEMLIAKNIKLLMNSIVLPGATNTSAFHTIELNNAFRISYTEEPKTT